MNRLAISIAVFLGVVLLFCAVLERLGMGDIVKSAGIHVREKAGLANSSPAAGQQSDYTTEIEKLLGFSISEIRTQPVKALLRAREKIVDEIGISKELQLRSKVTEMVGEGKIAENETRRTELLAILEKADEVVSNPDTEYPVKVGNFTYHSKNELLIAAVGMRKDERRLAGESAKLVNVPNSAIKNAREIRHRIEVLEAALNDVNTALSLAESEEVNKKVAEQRDVIGPLTDIPTVIEEGIQKPKEDGYAPHDPTDEELMREAFGR